MAKACGSIFIRQAAALVVLIVALAIVGCGGGKSTPVTLTSITVLPANKSVAVGTTVQFKASGGYSDGSYRDLTASVAWSSSNSAIASVGTAEGSKGLVSALAAGTVTITATSGGITGSTSFTSAALAAIDVTPSNSTFVAGTSHQFKATGILANGATQDLTNLATWDSSDSTVSVINATGLASTIAAGQATISAAFSGVSGSTTLTAATITSLAVSPLNPVVAAGTTRQFSAIATLSNSATLDVTSLVSWSSSDIVIATISSGGIASARSIGPATITALYGAVSGTTTLTVQGPVSIAITPANPSVVAGSTQKFSAVGTFADGSTGDVTTLVAWSSSNSAVATITGGGTATVKAAGTTTITATLGVSGSTTMTATALTALDVTPAAPVVGVGSTLQLAATGTFSDNSTQDLTGSVTWASGNTGIAAISNTAATKGVVTAVAPGSTTITATFNGTVKTITLTVNQANRAYVANNGGNSLSVVNTVNNSLVTTIGVGTAPQGVAVNTAANRAYVTNSGAGTLSVIDTTTNTVIATVSVGSSPKGVAVNPSAGRVYVANSFSNTLSVLDAATNSLLATVGVGIGPQAVAVNAAAGRVYVANTTGNTVSIINSATNTVVSTVTVGFGPQAVAVIPASNRVYVANGTSNTVSVIDSASNAVTGTISVGTKPVAIALNTGANRAYVVNSGSNSISVINTSTNSVVETISVGSAPQGIAVNTVTGRAYVTLGGSNMLSVVDLAAGASVASVGVGVAPRDVVVVQ